MPTDIDPASDEFSKSGMKPLSDEEASSIWASRLAANTGYLAGLRRTIISGDIHLQIPGDEAGEWNWYSNHTGWVDAERHRGELEIKTMRCEGIGVLTFWINGTSIYNKSSGFSDGSCIKIDILSLTDYTAGNPEGTLDGTLRVVDNGGMAALSVSFDLYCYPLT